MYVGIFCWKLPRRKTLVYERSPSSLLPCRVRWTNDWPIVLYICVGYGGDNWARADEPNRYVRCDWWPAPRVHHLRFVDFVWRMARVWCHGVWYEVGPMAHGPCVCHAPPRAFFEQGVVGCKLSGTLLLLLMLFSFSNLTFIWGSKSVVSLCGCPFVP